jgi:hypothetical protein
MDSLVGEISSFLSDLYQQTLKANKVRRLVLREFQDTLRMVSTYNMEMKKALHARLKIDSTIDVAFSCCLDVARAVYKHPYLLYHNISPLERKRNNLELERLVRTTVKRFAREKYVANADKHEDEVQVEDEVEDEDEVQTEDVYKDEVDVEDDVEDVYEDEDEDVYEDEGEDVYEDEDEDVYEDEDEDVYEDEDEDVSEHDKEDKEDKEDIVQDKDIVDDKFEVESFSGLEDEDSGTEYTEDTLYSDEFSEDNDEVLGPGVPYTKKPTKRVDVISPREHNTNNIEVVKIL